MHTGAASWCEQVAPLRRFEGSGTVIHVDVRRRGTPRGGNFFEARSRGSCEISVAKRSEKASVGAG